MSLFYPHPSLEYGLSEDYAQFVSLCLRKDINERLSSEQLCMHEFFLTGQANETTVLAALAKELQAAVQAPTKRNSGVHSTNSMVAMFAKNM